MKKLAFWLLVAVLVLGTVAVQAGPGPAPNSGDGVTDGSGFDVPPGPIGDGDPFGPAPNGGDGVPDGSGMDAPNNRVM